VNTLLQDIRFAVRQMLRSPGFAITAVLVLALGIAANVIVFGVLQALVLRPLNVPHADRVVTLEQINQGPNLSFPVVRDIRDANTVFSAVAADRVMDFGLEANGVTRPVWGYEVSGQYFEVLAIKPLLGRLLQRSEDDHPGAAEAAVLSWTAWKSYFNSDPAIVGRVVRIDKHPYTIIGVTPRGFYGTEKFVQPDIFVPMANEAQLEGYDWLNTRYNQNVWVVARAKDGIALKQVQAELKTLASRIAHQHPSEDEKLSLQAVRPGLLGDLFGGPARAFLAGIMGLAGIVLLAACANLGSLFAARTADRSREIAIRMAVGSSRWRILRQLITEAFLIATIGGACACVIAWTALTALASWQPPTNFPIHFAVLPQPSLIAVALLFSLTAGILFGIIPLRQILKADPNEAIKTGGYSNAGGRWALRDILLAVQIALCCLTVTAAFVSLRGLKKTLTMDMGITPENAVLTKFELGQAGYSREQADRFQRQLLDRVAALPGVDAAGYGNTTPLALDQSTTDVYRQETTDFRASTEAFAASYYKVSPGYFKAAGTPLLQGRDFSFADGSKAPLVAIVNREFVTELFHTDQAVGRYFKNGGGDRIQIVGIVADGKYQHLSEEPKPAIFYPIVQDGDTTTAMIVRTRMDASEMAASVDKLVHDLDSGVPIMESGSWRSQLALQMFPAQVATIALGLFGSFGLLLSITGIFGLASYTVSKRVRELSIRVALGAQAKQVVSAALGRMLVLLAFGSVVGLGLGVAASSLLSAVVYQASAQDPLVLVSVALTMLLTGLLSVIKPVRRALHVDPAHLLREQ
jgi:predicted permease